MVSRTPATPGPGKGGEMTLTATSRITRGKQFQSLMVAGSRPQDRPHGCRHPPPSARPNQFSPSKLESTGRRTVANLQSSLLKISPWWLYVTPARRNRCHHGMRPACGGSACQRGTGCRLKPSSGPHATFKGLEQQEVNSLEGGFAYARHDCCRSSSRGVKEWK